MNHYNSQQIGGYIILSIIATCIILSLLYAYFKLIYCCYKEYLQNNNIREQLI